MQQLLYICRALPSVGDFASPRGIGGHDWRRPHGMLMQPGLSTGLTCITKVEPTGPYVGLAEISS